MASPLTFVVFLQGDISVYLVNSERDAKKKPGYPTASYYVSLLNLPCEGRRKLTHPKETEAKFLKGSPERMPVLTSGVWAKVELCASYAGARESLVRSCSSDREVSIDSALRAG